MSHELVPTMWVLKRRVAPGRTRLSDLNVVCNLDSRARVWYFGCREIVYSGALELEFTYKYSDWRSSRNCIFTPRLRSQDHSPWHQVQQCTFGRYDGASCVWFWFSKVIGGRFLPCYNDCCWHVWLSGTRYIPACTDAESVVIGLKVQGSVSQVSSDRTVQASSLHVKESHWVWRLDNF